jgi:hypothetical protein
MDIKTKTTIKYILENSTTMVDLKWKLGKFVENGDVSFLGHSVKELNERIDWAESKDRVMKSDFIISITKTEPCETATRLNIKKVKRDDNT